MNTRFEQAWEKFNHWCFILNKQERKGYEVANSPVTTMVLERGDETQSYGIINGELRRVCV